MTSLKSKAQFAGLLYLVMGLAGAFSIAFIPKAFMVKGDAAATAAKIVASPLLYRFGIVSDLVNQVAFILVAIVFYEMFKDVNRRYARLLVAFVLVQVSMTAAIELTQIAPLVLQSGADYLAVFGKPQLDAMTLAFLSLRSQALIALGTYMGLWLLPLGALVYKSGFLPRVIGVLLLVAGVAYVLNTLTFFLAKDLFSYSTMFMVLASAAGELSIMGYLLIMGAREKVA